MKWCPRCDETKPAWGFNVDKRENDGLSLLCWLCESVKNRPNRCDYRGVVSWRAKRAKAVEIYGGVCVMCGGTDRLEFDHVNGDGREHRKIEDAMATIRRIVRTGRPIEDWELRLLCWECHHGQGSKQRRAAFDAARKAAAG